MKELSIEGKATRYDGNYKAYTELINRLENVKDAIKKQNYGIAMNVLCKPYPEYQITTSTELAENEDERIRKWLIFTLKSLNNSPVQIDGAYEMMLPAISWLENQGGTFTKKDVDDAYLKGVCDAKHELKKQGEQKPADNEPKFKVKKGEWYVCTDTFVSKGKIIAIKGQTYQSQQEDDTITCEDNCLFIDRHDGKASDYFRSWTIQDAKEGDVLSWDDSKCIAIFKNIYDEDSFNSYGFVGGCTGTFESRVSYHDIEGAHPATKEQSDTLIKAMTDAGYTVDFEKKELKKIEQKPAENKGMNLAEEDMTPFQKKVFCIIDTTIEEELGLKQVCDELLRLAHDEIIQKSTWSEEDEEIRNFVTNKKEPVSDDLDKEINKYISDNFFGSETMGFFSNKTKEELNDKDVADIARHFANWQKQQDSKLPKIWPRDTIEEYAYQCAYDLSNDWAKETPEWNDVQNACILGAQWQKEQMMKDSVDGVVLISHYSQYATVEADLPQFSQYENLENVKLIIIKEN